MTEEREVPRGEARTIVVPLWRRWLAACRGIGHVRRWIDPRGAGLLVLLAPAVLFAAQDLAVLAIVSGGLWVVLVIALARRAAQDRLIVGDFRWVAEEQPEKADKSDKSDKSGAPPVRLGNLLLVELSRLADLFNVVGDRRAVSSGLTHQRALDATLSVDDLVENLQGTLSSDAKANVGPLTIPLAPLLALFGWVVRAPRLTGNLHRDGNVLILTAQLSRDGMSWRVQRPEDMELPEEDDDLIADDEVTDEVRTPGEQGVEIVISKMVEELALRIYTDLALGRAVRWQASECFVEGLRSFRKCLRTPKDRKYNLKRAEQQFLSTLAEDEDFPLVYYNLGVVYTELHGLAVAGGRRAEAKTRLSAAETSFGRAIERDPTRGEAYFAFAQTQFRYERWDRVTELCEHIVTQIKPNPAGEAKTLDLWARALMRRGDEEHPRPEDYTEAVAKARSASRLALRALARSRRRSARPPRGEDTPESRCAELAAGCLLTFSDIYSHKMPPADKLASWGPRRLMQARIRRNAAALAELAPVKQGHAQVRFDFGRRLLKLGHLEDAEEELAAAVQSDPTRPSYAAGLALARARLATRDKRKVTPAERDEIVGLCLRALQGLAGAFFPSRDPDACKIVADVYRCLGSDSEADARTADQLDAIAEGVEDELDRNVDGVAVSSIFLEVLQESGIPLAQKMGAYGAAIQAARSRLEAGRRLSGENERSEAQTKFQEALAAAESATSLNPLSTLAWETLGDIHRELVDFQNARLAWKHALTTDPDNPRLHDRIGSSYWHIAFQDRARASRRDLEKAAELFARALVLYGSGNFKDQEQLTHYRLGKLYAALRDFPKARRHLEIVEAVQTYPPLVGWRELGFAYLECRSFSECEYYFDKVVREGERIAKDHSLPPHKLIGDRLDEELWPLALIRAWGHLGLAITYAERDGNLTKALGHVTRAEKLLAALYPDLAEAASHERFPTRAAATVLECRGLISLRAGEPDEAIEPLEAAVSRFPHSRAYFELGLALEQHAVSHPDTREEDRARAQRLFGHGVSLRKVPEPPPEVDAAMERLARLSADGLT